MAFHDLAGAACRALMARKDGPSLYDVCDPLLLNGGGDAHLGQFYRTALANPALRPLLRRTGLTELNDTSKLNALREALVRARDDEQPDWAAIGQPVADLLDTIKLSHPRPKPVSGAETAPPKLAEHRAGDPRLRRAPAALVQEERLHPGLCRLQPDRRPRHAAAASS